MIYLQSVFEPWAIESESVQAVITSPPYYALRKYSIPDIIIGGDKDCKHEWRELNSCSQLLSFETERIVFIDKGGESNTVGGIEMNNETSSSFIEIRRQPHSNQTIFQADTKFLASRRKTNSSNFINCPIAIQHTTQEIIDKFGWNLREYNNKAFLGNDIKSTQNSNEIFRPDNPSPDFSICFCPILNNCGGRCNMIPNIFNEFYIGGDKIDKSIFPNTSIRYEQTDYIGKFRCPSFKEGIIDVPFSISPIDVVRRGSTTTSHGAKIFIPFKLVSGSFRFFATTNTLKDLSIISTLPRTMFSVLMGSFKSLITPNTTLNHGNYIICQNCGAVKTQYGLEPFFEGKYLLMPNGNIWFTNGYVEHTRLWAKEAWRVLKNDGIMFLNLADSYAGSGGAGGDYNKGGLREGQEKYKQNKINYLSKCQLLIPHRVAISLVDDGWTLRNTIVWYKTNAMPESVTDRFSKKYEYIFMFTKQEKYYFDLDAVREKCSSVNKLRNKNSELSNNGYIGDRFSKGERPEQHPAGKNPGDVWQIPTQPSAEKHFAMWPERLVERMVKCSTKAGDTVLDCFAGSATTLKVAEQLHRKGIGIDLGYHEISKRRTSKIQKEMFV